MPRDTPVLLVVDENPSVAPFIAAAARESGYVVRTFGGGHETIPHLKALRPDVALVDLQMAGTDGLDVVAALRARAPDCQPIVMSGRPTIESAVAAIKAGAVEYISKPLDPARLRTLLQQAREEIDRRAARVEGIEVTREALRTTFGTSAIAHELFALLERLAPHVRTALLTGETGAGKEVAARLLHELGPRRERAFVTIACATIADAHIERDLIARLGAEGIEGTIFLDEVADLSLASQAQLLHVIDGPACVLSATNRNLEEACRTGRFRRDLLFRLNAVEVAIRPLRERRDDIPVLAARFLAEACARVGAAVDGIAPAAERRLRAYAWPGNVRELRHVIERACMLADGPLLLESDIDRALPSGARFTLGPEDAESARGNVLKQLELERVRRALIETGGNKAAAARKLGVTRSLVGRRMKELETLDAAAQAGRSDASTTPEESEPGSADGPRRRVPR